LTTILSTGTALAADVTVSPPAGGSVVINSAPGSPALVVQPGQQVRLPGLPAANAYADGVCHDANGNLGRCDAPTPGQSGADVITSGWFTLPAAVDGVLDQSNVKETVGNIPALTASALAEYDIHVYINWGLATVGTVPLPYTSNVGGKPSTISFRATVGQLHIWRFTHDNSASVNLGSVFYRYVLIPRVTLGPAPTP